MAQNTSFVVSICIPRAFLNIRETRIRGVIKALQLGDVGRVDFVRKDGKGKPFNCVFIHFTSWNHGNANADNVLAKLNNDEQVKIVYDDPWYWMISKSKAKVPTKRAPPKSILDGGKVSSAAALPKPQLRRSKAVKLRTDTPYTPSATSAPSSHPALTRQSSNTSELVDGSGYDPALQPDEELRGTSKSSEE